MSASVPVNASLSPMPAAGKAPNARARTRAGRWWLFASLVALVAVTLIPIAVTVILALQPEPSTGSRAPATLANFFNVVQNTLTLDWLGNSLLVSLVTVAASVAVGAPGGYVLSRGRSRLVSGYSLILFIVQSLPTITMVIPLFMLFASFGLVDSLGGLAIVYVGGAIPVATWMMAAYFDTIPVSLEEAAWIDGCSIFSGFWRVVLPNSLPGVLSTAVFSFLLAWNDYLIVLVFLKTDTIFTLPVGLQSFFQQNTTDWSSVMAVAVIMMIPPVLVFAVLNRYFSLGGIGGALGSR